MPLLEKQGRTLRLTPAGHRLVEHADVILGSLAAADADLQALRAGRRGTVGVAAFPSAARVLLPRVWALLAAGEGGVDTDDGGRADNRDEEVGGVRSDRPELRIIEAEPDAASEALRRRDVDIAVVHAYSLLPRDVPPGCEQHRLAEDPVLLAIHPDAAARRGLEPGAPADLSDLRDEDWLMPGPETSCHELIRRACGAAGFVPAPIALATDFSVLVALTAAGAGVAVVPRMALPADTGGVSLHPLASPVTRTISALTRSGEARQPRLARVLECLLAAAG